MYKNYGMLRCFLSVSSTIAAMTSTFCLIIDSMNASMVLEDRGT